jgi:hypothetical protein
VDLRSGDRTILSERREATVCCGGLQGIALRGDGTLLLADSGIEPALQAADVAVGARSRLAALPSSSRGMALLLDEVRDRVVVGGEQGSICVFGCAGDAEPLRGRIRAVALSSREWSTLADETQGAGPLHSVDRLAWSHSGGLLWAFDASLAALLAVEPESGDSVIVAR